jgi:hypothetical protein
VLTFHYVCFAWVFFNADSFAIASEYLLGLTKGGFQSKVVNEFTGLTLILCLVGQMLPEGTLANLEIKTARVPLFVQGATLGFFVVCLSALSPGVLSPFIYFKF